MTRTQKRLWLGLGIVVLLGAGCWWASGIRLVDYWKLSPILPTRTKGLLTAHSVDGIHFTVAREALVRSSATSQTHLRKESGELLVIGTDATNLMGRDSSGNLVAPKISTLFTLDPESGAQIPFQIDPCVNISGDLSTVPVQCVDPNLVIMPDGHQRIFFVHVPGRGDPAFASAENKFLSAKFNEDGVWEGEPGVRFTAKHSADPDLVSLPDGRFRLYYTSGQVVSPFGAGEAPGILSAISTDGLKFTAEPGVRAFPCSASSTLAMPTGGYRLYCHTRQIFQGLDNTDDPTAFIVSYWSDDGLKFKREAGVRIGAVPVPEARYIGAAAPSVSIDQDGSLTMLVTTAVEPRFPWNWLFLRGEMRHLEETDHNTQQRGIGGGAR